jgi:hypothetical protein
VLQAGASEGGRHRHIKMELIQGNCTDYCRSLDSTLVGSSIMTDNVLSLSNIHLTTGNLSRKREKKEKRFFDTGALS